MDQKEGGFEFNAAVPLTFSLNDDNPTDTKHEAQHDSLPFQLIMCENKQYTSVIKEEPDSATKLHAVTSTKQEELLIPVVYPVPKTEECEKTLHLAAVGDEEEELCEDSHTDFTACNVKCGHLPERGTTFTCNVSSEHQSEDVQANAKEMPLVCDMCGMTFMRLIQFQTHICTHVGAKHIEQEVCSAAFSTEDNPESSVSSNTRKTFLQCTVCKDGFASKSILKRHILTHPERDPLEFQRCRKSFQYTYKIGTETAKKSARCHICGKRFSQFGNLKRHFLTHTGNKPFKCDVCGKLFSRSAHVKDHILTHTGIRAFKCDLCDRGFLKSEHLQFHMYTHTGEKPFKCDTCPKVFSRRGHLTVHHLTHTGGSQFKCDICGNAFSQKGHLKRHILTHTGEKHFKCDICGKEFSQRGQLKRHNLTHTGENSYKCNICGKAFSVSGNLKRHILTHTGEKHFKCDICGKEFSQSGHLKRHNFMHTGENSFKCDMCGKEFSQNGNLIYHIRTHTGEKPFKCNVCGKGFPIKSKLKYHMVVHIQT